MTARRSLAVTLPFLRLAGQTAGPSCTTGRPLPAQSAEVTDNQPAMMHICVSVCAVRKVRSSMPRLSALNTVYPQVAQKKNHVVGVCREQFRLSTFECVQGINKSLQQITGRRFQMSE